MNNNNNNKDNKDEKIILIIGDIMLDVYHYCTTTRNAAESNIPLYKINNTKYILGGAGNVANNIHILFTSLKNSNHTAVCYSSNSTLESQQNSNGESRERFDLDADSKFHCYNNETNIKETEKMIQSPESKENSASNSSRTNKQN